MANILVTGGAGFIGSHTCKELHKKGHIPITLDNLSRGSKENVKWGPLIEGAIHDYELVKKVISSNQITAVIHFAAYAYVSESVEYPQMYFENNVSGSARLLEAILEENVKNILFSSSCATYGESTEQMISESHPQNPINPYGLSKLMTEELLLKHQAQGRLNFCGLRYFNAAGTDRDLDLLERHNPEPHILPTIIRAGLNNKKVTINGNNYPTHDGTCVRDYIHVSDLATAHTLALDALLNNQALEPFYNLSNLKGFSLLELTQEVSKSLGHPIEIEFGDRRRGDPAYLVGNSERFQSRFSWAPENSDIKNIIDTAVAGQRRLLKL